MKLIMLALCSLFGTGALVYSLWYDADAQTGSIDPSRSVQVVALGPLGIVVTQEGTLKAAKTQKLRHHLPLLRYPPAPLPCVAHRNVLKRDIPHIYERGICEEHLF